MFRCSRRLLKSAAPLVSRCSSSQSQGVEQERLLQAILGASKERQLQPSIGASILIRSMSSAAGPVSPAAGATARARKKAPRLRMRSASRIDAAALLLFTVRRVLLLLLTRLYPPPSCPLLAAAAAAAQWQAPAPYHAAAAAPPPSIGGSGGGALAAAGALPASADAAVQRLRTTAAPIERYLLLRALLAAEPRLYYELLLTHTEEVLPFVYTVRGTGGGRRAGRRGEQGEGNRRGEEGGKKG